MELILILIGTAPSHLVIAAAFYFDIIVLVDLRFRLIHWDKHTLNQQLNQYVNLKLSI